MPLDESCYVAQLLFATTNRIMRSTDTIAVMSKLSIK